MHKLDTRLPFPIFPSLAEMKDMDHRDRPDYLLGAGLSEEQWRDYELAFEFLLSYGMRSKETFNSYRSDIQTLLLWVWLQSSGKSLPSVGRKEIESFLEFSHEPPREWVMSSRLRHFHPQEGSLSPNPEWRPFRVSKDDLLGRSTKIKRKIAHSSLLKLFSSLSSFFDFLVDERRAKVNPVASAKKRSPYMIKDAQIKKGHRLSEDAWYSVVDELVKMANDDPKFERALFVIVLMKTCYLRVSELSERDAWSPTMGDFFQQEGFWWLKVYGKGRKIRDVTVPEAFLPYLIRYRESRGLHGTPEPKESHPIIPKARGVGNIGQRQLTRLIDEAMEELERRISAHGDHESAKQIAQATTHWLRHTGASMDIDQRPLKHLSDELGHASLGTTDRIYVQSDQKERAQSGKRRKI